MHRPSVTTVHISCNTIKIFIGSYDYYYKTINAVSVRLSLCACLDLTLSITVTVSFSYGDPFRYTVISFHQQIKIHEIIKYHNNKLDAGTLHSETHLNSAVGDDNN